MKTNCVRSSLGALAIVLAMSASGFAQQTGTLKVKTTTGRAGVFVDDKYLGPAANFGMTRSYAVAAGDHAVTLREPRYETATAHVTIVRGKTVTVRQDLKALPERKVRLASCARKGRRNSQPST